MTNEGRAPITNPFTHRGSGRRYAKGRPFYHPAVMEYLRESLALAEPVPAALDVGCGTGLSSLALATIAQRVVGVDASGEMLAAATPAETIEYVRASAEALPLRDGAFDLVTVSQVIHWLDRARFVAEARRVLRPGGWLVVYDQHLSPRQPRVDAEAWARFREEFHARFPRLPRGALPLEEEAWRDEGFALRHRHTIQSTPPFTPETFVDYLVSQSNVLVAGDDEPARAFLEERVRPFFAAGDDSAILFEGLVLALQRAS